MDLQTLKKYDSQKMYEVYDRWPKIANEAYFQEADTLEFSKIDHIVFAGMGGSGALGDFFSSILSKEDIHVSVVKGYLLPKTVDSQTLVVITSISGNTTETLSVLNLALQTKCKIICFSSGGKIEDVCLKNEIEFSKISQIHSPRASFIEFLFRMLKILEKSLPLNKNDILEALSTLESLQKEISSNNLTEKNPSLNLANWMKGIPMIYYPAGLQAVAIRFKNSLQENAKTHAIAEDIVETCHNGIVSWEKKSCVEPILIQGIDDYIKTKERWKILEEFFEKKEIKYYKIQSVEGSILSKLINLIYLLDYASIYYSVLSKINPTPIESIDYIKEKIK